MIGEVCIVSRAKAVAAELAVGRAPGWLEVQISRATLSACRIIRNPPRVMLVVSKFPLALCDRLAFRLPCQLPGGLDIAKGCRHRADLTSSSALRKAAVCRTVPQCT